MKRTSDTTIISAMLVLSRDIESQDGIANAAILEAANRMNEMYLSLKEISELKIDSWARRKARETLFNLKETP